MARLRACVRVAPEARTMHRITKRGGVQLAIHEETAEGEGVRERRTSARAAWLRERVGLAHRADLTELLDGAEVDRGELERNLRDLSRLNRLPGGTDASIGAIRRLLPERAGVRVLDVGAGLADMAVAFAQRGWRTVAIDAHRDVTRAARMATSHEPLVEVVEADGRELPCGDGSFDVSHCSLLLHHLDPRDAIAVLREMARVARLGVVVNDLRRGILPFVATGVAVAVFGRCRTTRVDGLISARRAYTLAELDALLAEAGLEVRWRSAPFMPRVVTAAVPTMGR